MQPAFPSILQEDLDKNVKVFKVVKHFRGGRTIYHALMPKTKKMRKKMWEYQLQDWGDNTPGGHEAGWDIQTSRVKRIPGGSDRLAFNEDYIQ